ncbi:MAG TPA: thiamine pyrophosphate-binding protein [Acetobacteraceae bacterium]|nr:thiamine pyrophosphate-binding protein [Acetobacteraceae bacterium]
MSTTIGHYLIQRLAEIGARHVFGVPGDFSLLFLEQMAHTPHLAFIGCCNELNAAYAADGYARLAGIGALSTTYGVGELAALSGVAGAYAERVPIVCVTGAPPLDAMRSGALMHHSLADGNFENMYVCYKQFTVAQARLEPKNAGSEIDRVLRACWLEKRPVYIQLPSDLVAAEIPDIASPLDLRLPQSHSAGLLQAVSDIVQRLSAAKRPALLIDADVDRFALTALVLRLAETYDLPIASLAPAKGIVSDLHPHAIGSYRGAGSTQQVREAVEHSDCLIAIGARLTDVSTGLFTHDFGGTFLIDVQPFEVTVGDKTYRRVMSRDLLEKLLFAAPQGTSPPVPRPSAPAGGAGRPNHSGKLTQDSFWTKVQDFIRPGDVILADTGTCSFAAGTLLLPENTIFVSQPIWGSIGYALPATLGACLAGPDRRQLLFIGDGAFQMTAQELSTILRLELNPVIFLINNDGYTIERLILGAEAAYNDIQPWAYRDMPGTFGLADRVRRHVAATEEELDAALAAAGKNAGASFIEILLPRMDAPGMLAKFARRAAEFDFPQLRDKPAQVD